MTCATSRLDKLPAHAAGWKASRYRQKTDEALGTLDGVVIDPSERRIRYFVVHRRGWLRSHRYLLSADRPTQMTTDRRKLRLPVEPGELTSCQEFDAQSIPRFSDEHLLTALFCNTAKGDEADAA